MLVMMLYMLLSVDLCIGPVEKETHIHVLLPICTLILISETLNHLNRSIRLILVGNYLDRCFYMLTWPGDGSLVWPDRAIQTMGDLSSLTGRVDQTRNGARPTWPSSCQYLTKLVSNTKSPSGLSSPKGDNVDPITFSVASHLLPTWQTEPTSPVGVR